MNDNILLNTSNAIFEPHIFNNSDLPFIYHNSIIKSSDLTNYHENLELLYFKNGSGFVKYNSEYHTVNQGDVIIVNSYATHQIIANGNINRICLIIDSSFCKYNDIDISDLSFTPLVHDEILIRYFDKIDEEYNSKNNFKSTSIKCAVLNMLLFLCQNYSSADKTHTKNYCSNDYIFSSIGYIKNNLDKKITADAVAANAGLSKYHFLREFKKVTGYTLTNYINIIRCEYAKELLRSGKYSVKEAALLCSFDNYSYFTNVFKKYTGFLPSDFTTK